MTTLAGKSQFVFEPKMSVAADAVAATDTPENLRPTLGPLAQLSYKPASWAYLVRFSATPTQGAADIKLMAGATVIRSDSVSFNGNSLISGAVAVDLSQVAGETPLRVEIDVTSAADAAITATVDSTVSVEQPVVVSGC